MRVVKHQTLFSNLQSCCHAEYLDVLLKVTLNALDEGREHPDKTVEVTSLLVGYEVTLKLTVDSTYKEETPVQVEVTGDAGLFQRVGADACQDIGLFAPNPDGLNTPVPNNP